MNSSAHQLTNSSTYIALIRIFLTAVLITFLASCAGDYTPKPRGYFRIDFPKHEYRAFDSTFPYAFEYPVYAVIRADSSKLAEPYWINILYPRFHAELHISYKVIGKNLPRYLEDARTLVNKHIQKANAITQQEYLNPEQKVFGLTYTIKGADAASPFQFYLTDSTKHFIRGALYFNLVPNNDSLAPVIDFLTEDIQHMITTLSWKK
jgi:gliding motility-associated lipoprotein GldD